jgi:hypothetical protein
MESVELQVELPMLLEVHSKGVADLINYWCTGWPNRNFGVRVNVLRELKESGIIKVKLIPTCINCADIFDKNLSGVSFHGHIRKNVWWIEIQSFQ